MTESIYEKICYQINNKYINDPNSSVKHDLNLEPITIYDHYDPEIAKYLRILLNYYLLHKNQMLYCLYIELIVTILSKLHFITL